MNDKLCAALGDFDGVHAGHRLLLQTAVYNEFGYVPAVYTFNNNCKGAPAVMSRTEKEQCIYKLGIKKIISDDFESVRGMKPDEFIEKVLYERLNVGMVVCGSDFRFGKNASGDADFLAESCREYGIKAAVIDPFFYNGKKLSSSMIRKKLASGDMESVFNMLGRHYSVTGKVIHGKELGRRHTVPTVNIPLKQGRAVPAYGVYITRTTVGNNVYNSISNVGVRPSVENTDAPNIETNLFDFEGEIYGEDITVEFIKMLRNERRFDSSDQLYMQIAQDMETAKTYFNGEHK